MANETRRRQSIGRGLRLCVDRTGQRRRDEGLNVLTVVAQESYADFAKGLQTEMEQALNVKLGIVTADLFAGLTYALPEGGTAVVSEQESKAVFQGLAAASLIDDQGHALPELRTALAQNAVPLPANLPIGRCPRSWTEFLHSQKDPDMNVFRSLDAYWVPKAGISGFERL